jgi:hypothetical protein
MAEGHITCVAFVIERVVAIIDAVVTAVVNVLIVHVVSKEN